MCLRIKVVFWDLRHSSPCIRVEIKPSDWLDFSQPEVVVEPLQRVQEGCLCLVRSSASFGLGQSRRTSSCFLSRTCIRSDSYIKCILLARRGLFAVARERSQRRIMRSFTRTWGPESQKGANEIVGEIEL